MTVDGRRFVDPEGRTLTLHGVNIEDKNRAHNYQSWHGPEDFARMRGWGFNCIRLIIIWDGVEPEPGQFDEAYLAEVDKRVQWAKDNGIYVLLDMHQDLFSAKLGADGAPAWACLDGGKANVKMGTVWSNAYLTSEAVHTAFDNFWANAPGPDGVGIQDHFAAAWRHVAQRYADEPAVVGYDLFNEPFIGSGVYDGLMAMLGAFAATLTEKQGAEAPEMGDLMQTFMDEAGRAQFYEYMNDMDVFASAMAAGAEAFAEFERTKLADMYNRVCAAIREVDKNHILFIETSMFSNAAVPSGVVPIVGPDGEREPLQAFAPHGYDIVTDTPDVANANPERVELIFKLHADTAARLGMPTLVGEWGAYCGLPGTLPAARDVVRQFEKHLFSDTFWSYSNQNGVDKAEYLPVLARPYPAAVAGVLLRYESDLDTGAFTCAWQEDPAVTAPTRIYLSELWYPNGAAVTVEPAGQGYVEEPVPGGEASKYVIIAPTGQAVERRVTVARAGGAAESH
ncbi:MAG: cellulase family glycosylhydrolase [Candidatus Hydrogenedentes bacterium]|nr:cellulase family glycosylhydrolase [Candidatus Hydrogenedentota bacterium]